MGNKICVDKKPSKIENIISFNSSQIDPNIINTAKNNIDKENPPSNSYQHLSMWCLSESIINNNENGININTNAYTNQNNNKQEGSILDKENIQNNNINNNRNNLEENNINNLCDEEPKISISPVEISNIHKNHFLLDSQNVYVLLLIFKKDSENEVENSPFPTGLWGIIESLSNMTPRGLLFAFPDTHNNSQNLESFLLSKRELNDSEFKYMLFIWNGKKSTAFLRSVSLMKAFDLDKALMSTQLVHFIYEGFFFNEKNNISIPEYVGCIQLGDVINNTVENSEGNSTPSSDKINNLHETVYLFKLLYPNTKYKKKHKHKKNKKINNLNLNSLSTYDGNDKKEQNIIYKGFNNYFLESGNKKNFYDNFTEIDIGSSNNIINLNNNINNLNNIDLNELSNNFSKNNNLEKSNLSNSTMKNNKNIVMPPKLNLNLNISGNKLIGINSLEDTSNSKSSLRMPTSKEENKKDELINGLNLNNNTNKQNNEQQKQTNDISVNKREKNDTNKLNEEEYLEEDDEDDDDLDLISSTNHDLIINKKYLIGSSTNNDNSLKKIKVPKLMVSLQKNPLSEEKLTERAKIKSEQEETLNILPESTLISTSQHIMNNNLSKTKINIGSIGLSGILNNNNLNDKMKNINQEKSSNGINSDNIDIKALNEDFSLKDSERKKIISEYYSKHLSEIIPNFLYISSYNATKNLELLEKNKITHIINCAADFCENVFEQENRFTYLSFYLKDHVLENIECIFYECIKFIESVKEKGGRVLVHCIQGISRSVSIVMAYIIFTKKVSYDKAFNLVQSKREISSPNFGFSIQLQNFYTRLYEDPAKYRYIPKIFAVGSFQNEQAGKIVCRLMNEPFYEHKENGLPRMLDKRGIFIIVSLTNVYLWLGSKISSTVKDIYLKTALEYVKILRQFEKAPQSPDGGGPIIVYDGKESDEFINDLLKTKEKITRFKRNISDIFPEWNSWYKEIKNVNNNEIKSIMKDKNNNGNCPNENNDKNNFSSSSNNEIKKGFFLYPNDKSDAVLDFDDLNDETFLIACIYQKNKPKIYLWKGKLVDINENVYNEYKNKVSKIFFKQYGLTDEQCNEIENIIETPLEESDEFLNFI